MNLADWGAIFQVAVMIMSAVGGWFVREIFSRLKEMDVEMSKLVAALNQLQVELAKNYVTKDDFKDSLDNIFAAIRRIEDKMDRK